VPWVAVNGNFYILSQMSFSSFECDIKMDPFRGKAKGNETPQQVAARELYEESAHLLDLRDVSAALKDENKGLYHVFLQLNCGDFAEFASQYDANCNQLKGNEEVQECLGVAFIPVDLNDLYFTIGESSIRLASQMKETLETAQAMVRANKTIPSICLERKAENGEVTWHGIQSDPPINVKLSQDRESLSQTVTGEDWQYSGMVANQERFLGFITYGIIQKLKKYPQDWSEITRSPGYKIISNHTDLKRLVDEARNSQEEVVKHFSELSISDM